MRNDVALSTIEHQKRGDGKQTRGKGTVSTGLELQRSKRDRDDNCKALHIQCSALRINTEVERDNDGGTRAMMTNPRSIAASRRALLLLLLLAPSG